VTGPRRFFQLHLSTALVLMVLAGGLLGANLIEFRYWTGIRTGYARGWPWKVDTRYRTFTPGPDVQLGWRNPGPTPNRSLRIAGNIAVALGILTVTGVILEWRLRREDNV